MKFRLNRLGGGDMEGLVERLSWIAFVVIILGALYFLIRRFIA